MNRPAIVVMGVSGCGKSSLGAALAAACGMRFVDGDDLHGADNIAKMKRGEPLGDADRWPWLDSVAATLADAQRAGHGVAVACSALKRAYRDRIRAGAGEVCFIFLDAPRNLIEDRLRQRQGHFMPAQLIDSQFAALERPTAAEADVVRVPAALPLQELLDMLLSSHGLEPLNTR